MNVSIFSQKDYENISDWTIGQNKPNSKPISVKKYFFSFPKALFSPILGTNSVPHLDKYRNDSRQRKIIFIKVLFRSISCNI